MSRDNSENKYFKEALEGFAYNVACGDAIRHMTDLGLSAEEIQKKLDFPTSLSNVQDTMKAHLEHKAEIAAGATEYEYIKEQDEYGHSSFRRVVKK